MKEIKFVTIESKLTGFGLGKGAKFCFTGHREIIKKMLNLGYEYKGFFPIELRGTGDIEKIDLIFEKINENEK